MNVEVPATEVEEYKADHRGRINLGAEYGDKKVTVAIIQSESDE